MSNRRCVRSMYDAELMGEEQRPELGREVMEAAPPTSMRSIGRHIERARRDLDVRRRDFDVEPDRNLRSDQIEQHCLRATESARHGLDSMQYSHGRSALVCAVNSHVLWVARQSAHWDPRRSRPHARHSPREWNQCTSCCSGSRHLGGSLGKVRRRIAHDEGVVQEPFARQVSGTEDRDACGTNGCRQVHGAAVVPDKESGRFKNCADSRTDKEPHRFNFGPGQDESRRSDRSCSMAAPTATRDQPESCVCMRRRNSDQFESPQSLTSYFVPMLMARLCPGLERDLEPSCQPLAHARLGAGRRRSAWRESIWPIEWRHRNSRAPSNFKSPVGKSQAALKVACVWYAGQPTNAAEAKEGGIAKGISRPRGSAR